MESYSLLKDVDLLGIEKAFKDIEGNANLKLRLPNGLKESGVFGLEGLVCQLIATWLRNNQGNAVLHSYAERAEPECFDSLSSNLYGICALRLADQVLLSNNKEAGTNIALATAFQRVKKL